MAELAVSGAARGVAVVTATIHLPRVGAWTADVRAAASQSIPSGKMELRLSDKLTLVGTVSRAAIHEGTSRVLLTAGAGALRKHVKAKHYTSPTVAVVCGDSLADVGELPAPSADGAVLATQLEHWTTDGMAAANQALRCLLPRAGSDVVWRHLPDGTLWTGRESWPDGGVRQFAQVDATPEDAVVEVTLLEPVVLPGTKLGDWKVDTVEMRVTGSAVRATIWTAP